MKPAERDLDIAKKEVEKMADATDFLDFEESWQNFLFRIEKAWDYTESVMGKNPKWQKWKSKHSSMRRKDPLLRFLKQARSAETHSVSPTIGKDIVLSLKERTGQPFSVENVSVSFEDGVLTWGVNTNDKTLDLEPSVLPGNPKLIRFQNRGEWYNPPTMHLNKRLNDPHPVAAALLCIDYYRGAISEADALISEA